MIILGFGECILIIMFLKLLIDVFVEYDLLIIILLIVLDEILLEFSRCMEKMLFFRVKI